MTTIGNSVTTIGTYTFYNCSGFTRIEILAPTAPSLGTTPFNGVTVTDIYVPTANLASYGGAGATWGGLTVVAF